MSGFILGKYFPDIVGALNLFAVYRQQHITSNHSRFFRRAVRHAWVLGVEDVVMPRLVEVVADVMEDQYPDLRKNVDFIRDVVSREEERFRRTLATGSQILEDAVAGLGEGEPLPGAVAFQLHDTFGFPVEVTEEMLTERGLTLDAVGFEAAMDE